MRTDAERWLKIAKAFGEKRGQNEYNINGVCYAVSLLLREDLERFSSLYSGHRMFDNLALFNSEVTKGGDYWPRNPEGDEQRVWACCLLAAMAQADGGNHKGEVNESEES